MASARTALKTPSPTILLLLRHCPPVLSLAIDPVLLLLTGRCLATGDVFYYAGASLLIRYIGMAVSSFFHVTIYTHTYTYIYIYIYIYTRTSVYIVLMLRMRRALLPSPIYCYMAWPWAQDEIYPYLNRTHWVTCRVLDEREL
jgi:hypothetical protein